MTRLVRSMLGIGTHRSSRLKPALAAALVAISGSAYAKSSSSGARFAGVHIKNFGQVDERLFRGAQPREDDYESLAALGIRTVIDLRDDPKAYAARAVKAAGLRYVNIPMSDTSRPSDAQVARFLAAVKDSNSGPFYLHCAGGRHRTGVMGAIYRLEHDGWTYNQAYKEMKAYNFYSRWGHGALKDYVHDYYEQRHQISRLSAQSSNK